MAKTAIENIEGVRLVTNDITVLPRPVFSDVTEKIKAAFQRHAFIDSFKIKIFITVNRVTLEGRVRSWQKEKMPKTRRGLPVVSPKSLTI